MGCIVPSGCIHTCDSPNYCDYNTIHNYVNSSLNSSSLKNRKCEISFRLREKSNGKCGISHEHDILFTQPTDRWNILLFCFKYISFFISLRFSIDFNLTNGIPPNKMFTNFEYIRVFTEYMHSHRKPCSL